MKKEIEQTAFDLKLVENEFAANQERDKLLKEREAQLESRINEEANRKAEILSEKALAFIRERGLYQEYILQMKKLTHTLKF